MSFAAKPVTPVVRNRLLLSLPPADLRLLLPRLEPVTLSVRTLLLVPDQPVEAVHFIESGTISMISILDNGAHTEVGLVGFEGMLGLPLLFGSATSPLEGLVQASGLALRLPAAGFQAALVEIPSLIGLLLRYVDAFHVQVAQQVACNNHHRIEQRLARWILMTAYRIDEESFPMTQEFMAHMLGVQRPGVNLAIGVLKRAGLVQHDRSHVRVLDRPGLEAAACECYATVQRRFAWLMPHTTIN